MRVRAVVHEAAGDAVAPADGLPQGELVAQLRRRAERERRARKEAERISELATRQLYEKQQDLEAYAVELKRSNDELQSFASVASHDLQEPLRKIQAFGDRLKATNADALDERGLDYLERMQDAAGRMRDLINDLLAFSRVTTKARPCVPVDLGAIAHEVLLDLDVAIHEAGARVELGELPTVDADPMQMRQLIQNLLSNALKFRRPEGLPTVRIAGARRDDDSTVEITVSDNGIGFEQKYAERVFGVFERLHGRNAYDGTGVGLAICKKIAERHGGRMAVDSTPGEGSTFAITLPASQAPEQQSR